MSKFTPSKSTKEMCALSEAYAATVDDLRLRFANIRKRKVWVCSTDYIRMFNRAIDRLEDLCDAYSVYASLDEVDVRILIGAIVDVVEFYSRWDKDDSLTMRAYQAYSHACETLKRCHAWHDYCDYVGVYTLEPGLHSN